MNNTTLLSLKQVTINLTACIYQKKLTFCRLDPFTVIVYVHRDDTE